MQGKKWMERICRRYSDILGEQLTGFYLHGSAAFGCASGASDLDFIVVMSGAPSQQQKREMIALLLCLSRESDAPGKGFEMWSKRFANHFVIPRPTCCTTRRAIKSSLPKIWTDGAAA